MELENNENNGIMARKEPKLKLKKQQEEEESLREEILLKQEIKELWDMTILSPSCVTEMKCIVNIDIPTHSILTH